MSFLKRLFGGGGEGAAAEAGPAEEHKGVTIRPAPEADGGQFRLAAVLTKEIGGETRTHRLIRADLFPSRELAAEAAVAKARRAIDEQGDALFP